jgi:GNAT superfamily N-acetyltransferase
MLKNKIEFEFLKKDSVKDFLYFTYPKFRLALLTVSPDFFCAIGVKINKKPAGLILASLSPAEKISALLSISVKTRYRNKGIGTKLFEILEKYLAENGYKKIAVEFIRDSKQINFLEKIITRSGWELPELKTMLCKIHYKRLLKAGWVTKYQLPENFSIFRWKEISEDEKMIIKSYEYKDGWYPENLNPFNLDIKMQSSNSLGLRFKGEIIGWIIVQKLSNNSLNYARLFVCRDFQDTGKIIILLSEAIKIQANEKISYGCFSFDMDNKKMKLFYEKRFKPFVNKTNEKMYSFKIL